MTTLAVVVYGNGEIFREYFNAIVASFGTSNFNTLIKIAILLAGITVISSYIMQRDLMVMVKWFGLYYLTIYILFMPKVSVEIIDQVNQGYVYRIDNVPLGLATIASYTSVLGDALTQLTEMNFTMPDDLRYGKTGLVFASRLVTEGGQFEITDANFDQNLQSFINQCVFYDILLNRYSVNDLMSTGDLWSFVSHNTSPARAFLYNGIVTVCKEGANNINKDWTAVIDSAMSLYASRIFPSDRNAKEQLIKYLPISYGYLTSVSNTANKIMQQSLMANAFQRGILHMGATLNATAAMESYAYTRAQEQKRLNNQTVGDMAAYWLPLMKNAFEAILYGSFIFVILLSVFPFGWMVLKNYVQALIWVQLWAPLYAVINLMVSYYSVLNSMAATAGVLSLKSMSGLLQINSDISGLAGYLSLSVPFIAKSLVTGMAGTFSQLAQYVGGVMQSTGAAGATESVTGNMSLGNTNFGNHSAFNTNANHFDTSGRYSSGLFAGQLSGGSTLTSMPDGSLVMSNQNAISNLGTSVNLAESIRTSATRQGESAFNHAQNDARNYSESMSSAMRNIYDLSKHMSHSTNSNEGWNVSTNAAIGQALNNISRLTTKFANDHNISYTDAERALSAAYVDGRAGVDIKTPGLGVGISAGVSVGGRREKDHSSSMDNRALYGAAKDFVKDTNYSTNMDAVERAVHDNSFRVSDENGQRLVNNTNASLDRAESARHDLSQSYQAAQSYREVASRAQEDSRSVNSNLSQPFLEWMTHQPGSNGNGNMTMRDVENIMKNHPALAADYANRFSDQYVKEIATHWNGDIQSSQQSIQQAYERGANHIEGQNAIEAGFQYMQSDITQKGSQAGVNLGQKIDASARIHTEKLIRENQQQISNSRTPIEDEGMIIQDSVIKNGAAL